MWYEYAGNQFQLAERGNWNWSGKEYKITGVQVNHPLLRLPDAYSGIPITFWDGSKEQLSSVEILYIPGSINTLKFHKPFPMLKKVEIEPGHGTFSTDGKMLFSADGKELVYSLAAGNQEIVRVPKNVRKIGPCAFQNAPCKKIIFENPDVAADKNAFDDSAWRKEQGTFCVVGNMFFCLNDRVKELRVPEGVRRFHEDAFRDHVPEHLVSPVMPPRKCIADLCDSHRYMSRGRCTELTITSPSAAIHFHALRSLKGVHGIHITPEHKKYCSAEGVVFTKDRRCLVFYPRSKRENRYVIPEGVLKIGRLAFDGQEFLEEVQMPDTVKILGAGAFYECKKLRKVRFSDSLREIPDDSAYQKGGVLERCTSLKEVVLPPKLQYLGNHAFYFSGLERITLNPKLRQIGEYALAAERLREISLPPSLERIGQGALFYARTVHAYVGTAKGLVAAVNTVVPGDSEVSANVQWSRCMVYAHRKSGTKEELFLIPESLKRSAACHLDMAWNDDEIDYDEYDACFEYITDGSERMEFAQLGILRLQKEEDNPYVAYMKHSALKLATRLVEEKKEKEFLAFLQKGYLSDNALDKLLKLANKNNLTTCSAYILKYQKACGSKKKKSFVL